MKVHITNYSEINEEFKCHAIVINEYDKEEFVINSKTNCTWIKEIVKMIDVICWKKSNSLKPFYHQVFSIIAPTITVEGTVKMQKFPSTTTITDISKNRKHFKI